MAPIVMRWTAVVGAATTLVLGLSLWLAGASLAAPVAMPGSVPAVTLPAAAPITEIGPLNASLYGRPIAVDDRGDVLYPGTVSYSAQGPIGQPGGVWHDGAFMPAPTPSGAILASPLDMNDDGLVAGGATASFPGFTGTEGYYWDTVTGDASISAVVAPVGGCSEEAGTFTAVDDTGEAGGYENNVVDDADCSSNVVAAGPGDAMEPTSGSPEIEAIQPDWEIVNPGGGSASSGWVRVDRSDGSTTPIPFYPTGGDLAPIQNALAPDGSVVGNALGGGVPEILLPDGTVHALPVPVGDTGEADAINDSGEIVGEIRARGVLWTSYTAQPINLNAILPVNSGWVVGAGIAISGQGNVLGFGTLNGTAATYVLRTGQTAVSGTVYGVRCSDAGCVPSGLPGQTIVVTGTATDGQPAGSSAITKADGTWTAYVPPGNYTAGPSFDGETIDGRGFDPEQFPDQGTFPVGATAVHDVNFLTCAGPPAATSAASVSASVVMWRRVANAASAPDICSGTYSFQASADVPQSSFVDPSPRAPYATQPDGTGYRANNQNHYFKGEWYGRLPACSKFNSQRAHPPALEWYSYYLGTGKGGLGAANVRLSYNSSDASVTLLPSPLLSAGSLTRVYEYRMSDGTKGSCKDPEKLVPLVGFTSQGTSFQLVISWVLPFTPEGVTNPRPDLVGIPGVASAVHKGVDAIAENIPGFKKLPLLAQQAAVFVVAHVLEEKLGFIGSHHPNLDVNTVTEMIESTISVEKTFNFGPAALYNFVSSQAFAAEGYHPLNVVIRGTFTTIPCPPISVFIQNPSRYRLCDDTELAMDVTTDRFPDYHLVLVRHGTAVSTTTVPGTVAVSAGGDAASLPDLTNSMSTFPDYKVRGGTLDMKDLALAMNFVQPGALEAAAGATVAFVPKQPPSCSATYTAGTSYTRCYTWADALP